MTNENPIYTDEQFNLIYAYLIQIAREQKLTTYGDIAVIIGLARKGNHMTKVVGSILIAICHQEFQAGRPPLTSTVVRAQGKNPGIGFYKAMYDLGLLWDDAEDSDEWDRMLKTTHRFWVAHAHYAYVRVPLNETCTTACQVLEIPSNK